MCWYENKTICFRIRSHNIFSIALFQVYTEYMIYTHAAWWRAVLLLYALICGFIDRLKNGRNDRSFFTPSCSICPLILKIKRAFLSSDLSYIVAVSIHFIISGLNHLTVYVADSIDDNMRVETLTLSNSRFITQRSNTSIHSSSHKSPARQLIIDAFGEHISHFCSITTSAIVNASSALTSPLTIRLTVITAVSDNL